MTKGFLNEMSMEVDDEDFDFRKFTDLNFQEKMHQEFAEQREEREKQFREENKEQKVKATGKDFQKLYRQLVKRAHPDLVSDPEKK